MLKVLNPTTANEGRQANLRLADPADLTEFEAGLAHFESGRWHNDQWRTFRLRFGVYEQRQIGQHMVRAKIPGGRVSFTQARAIAKATRDHTGGDIHITTRQNVQLYFIRQEVLPAFLGVLYGGGVSTREASGNTFRNITACPLAGFCPHERVNAAEVAERLSENWIRHPLTQHMPRKFKTAVSGCERDCGLTRIDDLGFIATRRGDRNGFRVVAGGGLGTHPHNAVEVFDFVSEDDLPVVQEALARVHHRHSNRADKNRSRIKYLVDRFGADGFRDKIHEVFDEIHTFPRPDSAPEPGVPFSWRDNPETEGQLAPLRGPVEQHDGRYAVAIKVPLGWISADHFDALINLAERAGGSGFVLTREQDILVRDMPDGQVQAFQKAVVALGLDVSGVEHVLGDVVACPGVATCAIGITSSHELAADLLASRGDFAGLPSVRLKISGCHNSCGQHQVADIGLHGLAKKITGRHAPHYRIHVGGDDVAGAISGPVIPASLAKQAIKILIEAYAEDRHDSESVHAWASRAGSDGISEVLSALPKPVKEDGGDWFIDIGRGETFRPPATATGECAAGAMVAEYLNDLAVVAREDLRRAVAVSDTHAAVEASLQALILPAKRLLNVAGADADVGEELSAVRVQWDHKANLLTALSSAVSAQRAFASGGDADSVVVALADWHNAANQVIDDLLNGVAGFLSRGVAE